MRNIEVISPLDGTGIGSIQCADAAAVDTAVQRAAAAFKVSAMDHGVQGHVSERYRPKVMDRMQTLKGSGQGAAFAQTQ